ncbi:cysteine dioxygenase [Spirillospora sp. CA-294931]|uniref:cysteine dioxygenase n=1 Tax=Spirillospora sp. CA-294931 TaxID=3240042 RepID=UPI003D89E7FC
MTATLARHPALEQLIEGVREAVGVRADWPATAGLVADRLRRCLPTPAILTPEQRLGDPDRARGHVLHIEPDSSFSVLAVVWRPGQGTRIHDHTTWCVFGGLQGVEHEIVYDEDLNPIGENDNHPGDVSGFAPPGDIHKVVNRTSVNAITLHIYGTDVSRIGSSVRRYYN